MSLINDALKRARKQTKARPRLSIATHETLEPVGDQTWTPASSERRRSLPWPWILVALLSLGLCLIVAGWFFGSAMALLRKPTVISDSRQDSIAQEAAENPERTADSTGMQTEADPVSPATVFVEKDKTSGVPSVVENDITSEQNSGDLKSSASGEIPIHLPLGAQMTEVKSENSLQELENTVNPQPPPPIAQSSVVMPAKVYLTKIPAEAGWPELRLQGIFYDADAPVALINNRDLLAGESLGKVRVISIESKKVTLQLGQEQKILQFRR